MEYAVHDCSQAGSMVDYGSYVARCNGRRELHNAVSGKAILHSMIVPLSYHMSPHMSTRCMNYTPFIMVDAR